MPAPINTDPPALKAFEAAVRSQCAQFAKHFAAGDFAALAESFYTDDATLLAPSAPKLTGHKSIAEALAGLKAGGFATAALEPLQLEVRDDLGYEVGRVRLATDAGKEQIGRYLVIWKRSGDTWRVKVDMFTTDTI